MKRVVSAPLLDTYRLYDPFTKNVIISRDVDFIENQSWDG